MAIVNLLEETIEKLERCGLTTADVRWVGWSNGWQAVGWQAFTAFANREYDNETETPQVHHNLVVVGDDWWLERDVVFESTSQIRQENWIYRSLPAQLKEEDQTSFFFTFESDEAVARDNPNYREALAKLQRMIYDKRLD